MMNIKYDFCTGEWTATQGLHPIRMDEPPSKDVIRCRNAMNERVRDKGPSGKVLLNEWRTNFDTERRMWGIRSDILRVVERDSGGVTEQVLSRIRLSPRRVQYGYREWHMERYPYSEKDIISKNPIKEWVVKE